MTTVEMRVHMDCAGCESKVRKTLLNLEGVDSVEIDMGMQKVTIMGWADKKKILKAVRKTGRRAELWQFPYDPLLKNHNYSGHNNYQQPAYYGGPAAYYTSAPPPSSYNYYKHGYDSHEYAYNYSHQGQSTIFGSRAGDTFNEENAHGCSIM